MSRRAKPDKRVIIPDARYQSLHISLFIARIMRRGKKSTAVRLMYDAMDLIKDRSGKEPLEVLDQALKNVGPSVEVKPRRVGGATYQVPHGSTQFPHGPPWPCAGSSMRCRHQSR